LLFPASLFKNIYQANGMEKVLKTPCGKTAGSLNVRNIFLITFAR